MRLGSLFERVLADTRCDTGYQVRIVEYVSQGIANMGGNDPADRAIHLDMAASFDWFVPFSLLCGAR